MNDILTSLQLPGECAGFPVWIVACSGGVDSVTLAHVLSLSGKKGSWSRPKIELHYVDHAQRTTTKKDIALVKTLAGNLKVDFRVHRTSLKKGASENEMRKARYAALTQAARENSAVLFTAHHAQDNLETYLYKICRGSNPATLVGIEPLTKKDGVEICRPLLNTQKSEILEFARNEKLEWVEDESNLNPRYMRNKIRMQLLPLLEEIHTGSAGHLLSFFTELAVLQGDKRKPDSQMSESFNKNFPVLIKTTDFLTLKTTLDGLLGEYSGRTTKGHWNNLKKIFKERTASSKGSGPRKVLQFPGGNCLVFNGNKLFWNPVK